MPPYRDSDMIHMFGALMRTHDILLNRILNRYGLYKSQPFILELLERYPGITQQELADCLKVSKATIAASLKRMEKVGFVQRAPDPQDTRRNRITITELGRKASHDCRQEVDHLRDTLFSQVTPQDEELLTDLLGRMYESLNRLREEDEDTEGMRPRNHHQNPRWEEGPDM